MSTESIGSGLPDVTQALFASQADELSKLKNATPAEQDTAAERFQTLFATMLVREMRRALPEGFFGKDAGADTFDSWLDDHLGKTLAEQDALGLAGMLKTSIADLSRRDAS